MTKVKLVNIICGRHKIVDENGVPIEPGNEIPIGHPNFSGRKIAEVEITPVNVVNGSAKDFLSFLKQNIKRNN